MNMRNSSGMHPGQRDLLQVFLALQENKLAEAQINLEKIKLHARCLSCELRYHTLWGELEARRYRPEIALTHLEEALDLIGKGGKFDQNSMDELHYWTGYSYLQMGHLKRAYSLQAPLLHSEGTSLLQMQLRSQVGLELVMMGLYPTSVNLFEQGLSLPEQWEQPGEMVKSYLGMGVCQKILGNYEQAAYYGRRALQLLEHCHSHIIGVMVHQFMSEILDIGGNFEQAESHEYDALKYAKIIGNPTWIANANAGIARTLASANRLPEANYYLDQATAISPHRNAFLSFQMAQHATIILQNGEVEKATNIFKRAVEYMGEAEEGAQAAAHYFFGLSLEKNCHYAEAAQVLREAVQFNSKNSIIIV